MVDVKTWKCFPTSIHQIKMNISNHDQMQMRSYVERGVKDDTLHTISYFKSLTKIIDEVTKQILEESGYEFEKIEITNMWGNKLETGQTHPPHTHSNNT